MNTTLFTRAAHLTSHFHHFVTNIETLRTTTTACRFIPMRIVYHRARPVLRCSPMQKKSRALLSAGFMGAPVVGLAVQEPDVSATTSKNMENSTLSTVRNRCGNQGLRVGDSKWRESTQTSNLARKYSSMAISTASTSTYPSQILTSLAEYQSPTRALQTLLTSSSEISISISESDPSSSPSSETQDPQQNQKPWFLSWILRKIALNIIVDGSILWFATWAEEQEQLEREKEMEEEAERMARVWEERRRWVRCVLLERGFGIWWLVELMLERREGGVLVGGKGESVDIGKQLERYNGRIMTMGALCSGEWVRRRGLRALGWDVVVLIDCFVRGLADWMDLSVREWFKEMFGGVLERKGMPI